MSQIEIRRIDEITKAIGGPQGPLVEEVPDYGRVQKSLWKIAEAEASVMNDEATWPNPFLSSSDT